MAQPRVAVRGSERRLIPGSTPAGRANPADSVSVTLVLRRRAPLVDGELLTREEFAARHGADPADIARVEAFAAEHDLSVGPIDIGRRSMVLSGTVAKMNEAFGTVLEIFTSPRGTFRGRTGRLFVPADISEIITGVFGLDDRPQARTRFRRHSETIQPRADGDTSYTPPQLAALYKFPAGQKGAGQTAAIIELGGGYRAADLTTYFNRLGLTPTPSVTAVSVDGAQNAPEGDPNSADGEVLLDIEIVGAIAPAAKIAVYFAPNTDQGFLDAITTSIHDNVRKPSVVSISWGAAESEWTTQSLDSYNDAFADARALGVTIFCAAGDDGSTDNVTDGAAHVDFPASSPNVVACGGTRLESANGRITRETVWNHGPGLGATGGGVSEHFAKPAYQSTANVPVSVNPSKFAGRGVPDIAGDADPATGYQIYVDGKDAVFGGTSAVSPLWAALTLLLNEKLGKPVGFINPTLYAKARPGDTLFDITSGNNGAYSAAPGWDACTGLGSPNGTALLALFTPTSRNTEDTSYSVKSATAGQAT